MYKITFYVPETHLEKVKTAMFAAGAGQIGHYDQCAWQVKGEGQFRPLAGSNAFLGEVNRVEKVEEYRVEMVVDKPFIKKVLVALKQAHPYESPAFDVIETITSFS